MRVTNNMLLDNYLNNLYGNLNKMDKLQTQVATNKRITKLSDDPMGVISSMKCRVKLYKIDQYRDNIENARTWLTQTESSVLEMNEVIKSAYETSVHVANDYMTEDDKNAAAELIGQLRDHVLTIANSKVGDKYIFGGYNVTNKPLTVDASGNILYNGLDLTNESDPALIAENEQIIEYEIGDDLQTQVSVTGSRLMKMGDDNIYSVLDNLYNALKSNESAEVIDEYVGKLQDCQTHVLAIESELGGRTNRLELVSNRYDEEFLNYTKTKSEIEDVDLAEAVMNFEMAKAVYTSALQIGSEIIQPSLVDFLK